MKIDLSTINTTYFKEHPIIDYRNEDPLDLDISAIGHPCNPNFTSDNEFDLKTYCQCLVLKLHSLPILVIRYFIGHQCDKVKRPIQWIKELEELMDANHAIFTKDIPRYVKLQAVIETAREKFQDFRLHYEPAFDFKKFKVEIEKCPIFEEKLKILIEKKTLFLQDNILNYSELNDKYIKLIELEISKLTDLQALGGQVKGQIRNLTFSEAQNKLKLNGPVNVVVDAFYQGMRELMFNGRPYFDASIKEIAELINNNFLDKNGQEIGLPTIQTFLSTSKSAKRPQGEKKIKLQSADIQ